MSFTLTAMADDHTNATTGAETARNDPLRVQSAPPDAGMSKGTEGSSDAVPRSPVLPEKPAWRLAPIRYWGNVVYDIREERVEGAPRLLQNLVSADINATSYIWQPWFAIVTAGLGLTVVKVTDSDSAGTDVSATGRLRFNLFPQSRFPFEARAERGDTRVDSGAGPSIDYKYTRLNLQQRYRAPESSTQYSASFDHYRQDATDTGRTTQDTLMFDVSMRPRPDQTASLNGQWNYNRRRNTGDETRFSSLVARHTYSPNANLSVDSTANLTYVLDDVGEAQSDFKILQANSIGFWRAPDRPLTVTGSVRLFALRAGTDENRAQSTVASTTVGANYAITSNLRAMASLSVTSGESAGTRENSSVETAGLTYDSSTIQLGPISYDWFAGATGTHVTGTSKDGFGGNAQLGHRLSREFRFAGDSRLGFSVGQSASVQTGAATDDTRQFTHTGSITWGTLGDGSSTFARLSGADSRFVDGKRLHFQLVNFQLTRTDRLGRNSSFSGTLTLQRSRQSAEDPLLPPELSGDRGFRTSASADLTYEHERVFGVPRLRFLSQIKINRDEVLQLLGSPEERESRFWENRLEYRIGRLESRFLVRVGDIDNRRRSLVMWKVVRQF